MEEDIHIVVGEVVGALLDWGGTRGLNGVGKELDVLLLVVRNVLQVVVVVVPVPGLLEIARAELLKGLVVEDVLEVLEGQGEVQDRGVDVGGLTLLQVGRSGGREACAKREGGGGAEVNHDGLKLCALNEWRSRERLLDEMGRRNWRVRAVFFIPSSIARAVSSKPFSHRYYRPLPPTTTTTTFDTHWHYDHRVRSIKHDSANHEQAP